MATGAPQSLAMDETDGSTHFASGVRRDRWILIGVAAIFTVFIALLASKGINGLRPSNYLGNLAVYAATLFLFVLPFGARELLRDRPDRPIAYLQDLAARNRVGARFMSGLPMLLALILYMPAFSAMKSAIPLFNTYGWDQFWIQADIAIHGTDPWRILQPVLGYPYVTSAISLAYHAWIMLIYAGGVFFCFFVSDERLRHRYFIAYFGIWTIIGVVFATMFASVGPCFLDLIAGDHHFDDLMAYLYEANTVAPVLVLDVQEQLLYWHLTGSHGLGRGITAMPSMHVAMALLFALAIRQYSRRLGYVFFAFFLVIMIASVHLSYHYAVDGYVSIIATLAIWKISAFLAGKPAPRRKSNLAA